MNAGPRSGPENFNRMTTAAIKIANAPCSWGALEFGLEGKSAGYEQVLDEIAATGYLGTELGDWGFMPTDPNDLAREIKARNLTLLGAFVPVALADEGAHDSGVDKALKVAALMHEAGYTNAFIVLADDNGTVADRTLNAGRITASQALSPAQLERFARGAEKIAVAVKEAFGLRTVFHHHCGGYIETPAEIKALLEVTDPSLLGLCFDTGHYMFGGGTDPLPLLENYWDRVWHIHFKDFDPALAKSGAGNNWDYFEAVKQGVFCELGKGAVNFKGVKELLEEKNYSGWIVVEQDVLPGMGNPKACASKNRQYLQSLGL